LNPVKSLLKSVRHNSAQVIFFREWHPAEKTGKHRLGKVAKETEIVFAKVLARGDDGGTAI
jgi:nicotinamidase-related amidase